MAGMRQKVEEFSIVSMVVFLFSYAANFIWESLHAVFLYEEHDFHAEKYIRMVIYASSVDGLLIVGIYLFTAIVWKDMLWLQKMDKKQRLAVFVLGMIVAAVVEYRKVFLLKAWSYTKLMPTVFGIGISPMFQLSITGMLAFWLTRRLLYQKGIYSRVQ